MPGMLQTLARWPLRSEAGLTLMTCVLLAAALMRFHDLTFQSLWLDELMTWFRSNQPGPGAVISSVRTDVWPPGYSLFMFVWMRILGGASEFLLRYPAALAGVASVAAIYTLGRRLAGHLTGLFAAMWMSVLQIALYYSQEARPYAALILYSTISTYLWLRIQERLARDERPTLVFTAGYVITALIAAYWNYYGLVLIAVQGLGAAAWHIRRPWRWGALALTYTAIALGYAPWIGETVHDLTTSTYAAAAPGGYIAEMMAYLRFLLNLSHPLALIATGITAAGLGADLIRKARGERAPLAAWALLLGWMLLPFTITYVKSVVSTSLLLHRYLLISLPAALLLISMGLARLPLPRLLLAGAAMLGAAFLLANLMWWWHYYAWDSKAQFRQVTAQVVSSESGLADDVLIVGYTGYRGTARLFDFYFEMLGSDRRVDVEAGRSEDTAALRAILGERQPARVWLLAAQTAPEPEILDLLGGTYSLVDQRSFYEAQVWVYGQ